MKRQRKTLLLGCGAIALLGATAWLLAVGGGGVPELPATVAWQESDEELVPADAASAEPGLPDGGPRQALAEPSLEPGALESRGPESDDEVRPEVVITGRVLDPEARPLARAHLVLEVASASARVAWSGSRGRSRVRKPVETGADGCFSFRGPGFARLSIRLLVTHQRFAPQVVERSFATAAAGPGPGEHQVGDVVMLHGGVLVGTVVGEAGVGVGVARLELLPERGNPLRVRDREELLPATHTDPSGYFRIAQVAPGDYRLEVSAPRHQLVRTDPIAVADGAEEQLGVIQLRAGEQISGSVLSPEGVGVPGAEVALYATRGRDTTARTDHLGHFVLDHLRAGAGSLRVRAAGYVTYHRARVDVGASAEPLVIQLRRGLALTGAVHDLRSGAPVTRYAARVRRVGALPEASASVAEVLADGAGSDRAGPDGGRRNRQDRDERRRLREAQRERQHEEGSASPRRRRGGDVGEVVDRPGGRFSFGGLDEGVYEVDVDSPEHEHATSAVIELRADRPAPHVVLHLQAGLRVSGAVVSALDGRGIEQARVELVAVEVAPETVEPIRRQSPLRTLFGGSRVRGTPVLSTRTDAGGAFVFAHAPAGRYALFARAPGHADLLSAEFELRAAVEPVTLELGALAGLRGQVAGIPPGREAEARVLAFGGPSNLQDVEVAPDGSYAIAELQPGSYLVRAFLGSMRRFVSSEMRRLTAAGADSIAHDVELGPGQQAVLDLRVEAPPVGEVAGSIVHNGAPGHGLRVRLRAMDEEDVTAAGGERRFRGAFRNDTRTDQDGGFRFEDVPEGEYELGVEGAGRRGQEFWRQTLFVQRDSRNEQRLEVFSARVRGEVRAVDGAPATELDGRLELCAGASERPADLDSFAGPHVTLRVRDGVVEDTELAVGAYLGRLSLRGREPVVLPLSLAAGEVVLTLDAGAKRGV